MKNSILFVFYFSGLAVPAQTNDWTKLFGNRVVGSYLYFIDKTSTGDIYSVGLFCDSVTIENYTFYTPGMCSSYLLKQKNDGDFYWGYSYSLGILSLLVDNNDDVLISGGGGGTNNDSDFIAKVNQQGNIEWLKILSSSGRFKAIDMDGNAVIEGSFYDSLILDTIKLFPFCNGCLTQYIGKVNQNGDFIWADEFNIPSAMSRSIVVDNSNNLYINGGLNDSSSSKNCFITKFDEVGSVLWSKKFIDGEYYSGSLQKDSSGNLYTCGWFRDSVKINNTVVYDEFCTNINNCGKVILTKLDTSGNIQWFKTSSKKWDNDWLNFTVNEQGEIFIAGNVSDTVWICDTILVPQHPLIYPQNETFLGKLNTDGKLIWNIRFLGNDENAIRAMASGRDESVNILGDFWGSYFLVGSDSLLSDGGCRIYSAQFKDTSQFGNNNSVGFTGPANRAGLEINIFPNPSHGKFKIQSTEKFYSITITNLIGERLFSSLFKIQNQSFSIDISSEPKGIYFLEIVSEGKREMKKIVLN